jgi:galactokinase
VNNFQTLNKLLPDALFHITSPGRVNLLGEHVDYNQGMVMPAAIDRYVRLAATPRADRLVRLKALDFQSEVSFSLDRLEERADVKGRPLPQWALYPAGVAWSLQAGGLPLNGLETVYSSDLPIGAGLSSSAAVELAFAVLWQELAEWQLDRMQLAQACQYAENRYVGVNCGLMDQFACAHGVARHALLFDVRSFSWQPLPLPMDTAIIIADSGISRTLAGSAYNQRRTECEQALELLRERIPDILSLRDVSPDQLTAHQNILPEVLLKRTRHVIGEIERVKQASYRLVENDAAGFGRLMVDGHQSLRDLYEVSLPELDILVDIAMEIDGCYGSRLTGAGFGGCTVSLVKKEIGEDFSRALDENYRSKTGRKANVYICQPSRGVWVENSTKDHHG